MAYLFQVRLRQGGGGVGGGGGWWGLVENEDQEPMGWRADFVCGVFFNSAKLKRGTPC